MGYPFDIPADPRETAGRSRMTSTILEALPVFIISQWRTGHVLSAEDVSVIERLLNECDTVEAEAIDAFTNGRRQALFEIGGQELVDAAEKADMADCGISLKRAYARFAAKEAELKSMQN